MRPYTEEPSAEQFACSVLDWRRVERSTRRPYGKRRPLGIPVMKCRSMQALYLLALDPVAETLADPHSYGFRPGRSTHQALAAMWKHTMDVRGGWVLEVDLRKFFDTLDHGHLRTFLQRRVCDGDGKRE